MPSQYRYKAVAGVAAAALLLAACSSGSINDDVAGPTITLPDRPTPGGSLSATEEVGVTNTSVLFGQSAALTGAAGELGRGMQRGIEAAFAQANAQGGVAGRTLQLTSYDDLYEPAQASENTSTLILSDQVFALIEKTITVLININF